MRVSIFSSLVNRIQGFTEKRTLALFTLTTALVFFTALPAFAQGNFIRGDANCDGVVDTLDRDAVAACVFGGLCPCRDAADVNDDGLLNPNDIVRINTYLSGGAPPPPPFPECGLDPTADGLSCVTSCCTPQQHYKTWKVFDFNPPVFRNVFVHDQFLNDNLLLDSIHYLSNPAQKDAHPILDPDDHLTWYRARGRAVDLEVEFVNQFQRDTIHIDSVRYLLLPTQKQPHPPFDSLNHYKAYRIINPQPVSRTVNILDQFGSELVNLLIPRYFLTPAQKNFGPVYDTMTHYIAYEFFPKRPRFETRQTIDQFGSHNIRVDSSFLLLVPTQKMAVRPPGGGPGAGPNHYKVWLANPQGFSANVQVQDQFMTEVINLNRISFLANPVLKIVPNEIGGSDTSDIIDPDDHLTWYGTTGKDTSIRVEYKNQFESTAVTIRAANWLLVPTIKEPHPPFDSLDHYKCYYIENPRWFQRPHLLQDQFDPQNFFEQIDSLQPVYFCTPCSKNNSPRYDTLTHYVAYYFAEPNRSVPPRNTQDQFGFHTLSFIGPWGLLVPTDKLRVDGQPECSDGLDNDGDGLVDFPADCGCTDPSDPTEAPNPPTECSDGIDNDGDGLIDFPADPDCANVCDNDEGVPPPTEPNHYKSWRIFDLAPPVFRTVFTQDQFMQDNIQLDSIHYLSNPAQKDAHPIIDPDDHLTWYRATGRNFPREIQFVNQFGKDTVRIDTLDYLLVPTQKFPHPPPDSVDHYKAYRIRNPQPFNRPVNMQDQFMPEFVNQLVPRYFLTPAQKNAEPVYDTVTHYVAYEFFPKRPLFQNRQTQDQFGFHNIRVDSSMFLLVPSDKTFVCPCAKGDINCSGTFSPADVVCLLNCVFLGSAALPCLCDLCLADVNCDGTLSPADVVAELNRVFLGTTTPPWCGS